MTPIAPPPSNPKLIFSFHPRRGRGGAIGLVSVSMKENGVQNASQPLCREGERICPIPSSPHQLFQPTFTPAPRTSITKTNREEIASKMLAEIMGMKKGAVKCLLIFLKSS
jgi:hypothetical protein